MRAVDAVARRLGTDHLDLYQVHFVGSGHTPIDETLQALDDLVRAGQGPLHRLLQRGWPTSWPGLSSAAAEVLGTVRFESVQPRYNLLFREFERELFPLCAEEQIAVIPYNPLAGGLLTGKHRAGAAPTEGTRFEARRPGSSATASATGTSTCLPHDRVDEGRRARRGHRRVRRRRSRCSGCWRTR
jgi:aryl-alcohol dehydrogenase-like predicted oxidoreductase